LPNYTTPPPRYYLVLLLIRTLFLFKPLLGCEVAALIPLPSIICCPICAHKSRHYQIFLVLLHLTVCTSFSNNFHDITNTSYLRTTPPCHFLFPLWDLSLPFVVLLSPTSIWILSHEKSVEGEWDERGRCVCGLSGIREPFRGFGHGTRDRNSIASLELPTITLLRFS
jgi:hypothetical protein